MGKNDSFSNGVYNEDILGEYVKNLIRYRTYRELNDDYDSELGEDFFSDDEKFFDGGLD